MTREEIIGMAREADPFGEYGRLFELAELTPETLERFAALVAAKEREECAKVCEGKSPDEYATGKVDHNERAWTASCAWAIRARGADAPITNEENGGPGWAALDSVMMP